MAANELMGTVAAGVERAGGVRTTVLDLDASPALALGYMDFSIWEAKLPASERPPVQAAPAPVATPKDVQGAMAAATRGIQPSTIGQRK